MSGIDPKTVAEAGSWLWSNRKWIEKKLKGLYGWFRKKRKDRGILILGTGGAGKTTLAKLLSGQYDWLLENPGRYEESIGVEKYPLKGGPSVEVVVPPGQKHRREGTWNDLFADIGQGTFRGIILLSANGYDTLGQVEVKDHYLYTGVLEEFLPRYLQEQRKDELAVLRALAPHVRVCPGKFWMLTLVAKQDLWNDQSSNVIRYYRHGKYGTELKKMINQQDSRRFRHEFAFASLVISNFTTGNGERLQRNVAGYDHQLQIESLRRLFQTVDGLKDWENTP